MHRFFLEQEDRISEGSITLIHPETINHLVKVLRARVNEKIELISISSVYICTIETISSTEVVLSILEQKSHENESNVSITLYQCLPKSDKLELILQKNVELGVNHFVLVSSKRCVVDYKEKDVPKKMERFSKIIKEAAKQSKRDRIPSIQGITSLKNVLQQIGDFDLFLVLYEQESASDIKTRLKHFEGKKIAVLVGPEGGFESSEVDLLTEAGALSTTLGKRILRTETAGFVAVSCLQYEFGAFE